MKRLLLIDSRDLTRMRYMWFTLHRLRLMSGIQLQKVETIGEQLEWLSLQMSSEGELSHLTKIGYRF